MARPPNEDIADEDIADEDIADKEITALVASWPLARAEAVARAFMVYFHLANLAEEHQRIRTLRERDTGTQPVRESLAAAMTSLGESLGSGGRSELLGRLEVHPVLTAHPTEARRRAVTEALRRIGMQLDAIDDTQPGVAAHAEARRRLREEIDLLWRTSALRSQAMQPLDEVRSGAAVFDETLFRLAPSVYRALDLALQGESSGSVVPQAPAFLRFGSWIGADRDGNPFVTAAVTAQTARIQADHALRALENATTRIGRSLTIDAALLTGPEPGGLDAIPAAAELLAALAAAAQAHPAIVGELTSRSPGEPFRAYLLLTAERVQATRLAQADDPAADSAGLAPLAGRAWPMRRLLSSSPTCGWRSGRWRQLAPPGRRTASSSTSSGRPRRSDSTWPSSRCGSTARCTRRRCGSCASGMTTRC